MPEGLNPPNPEEVERSNFRSSVIKILGPAYHVESGLRDNPTTNTFVKNAWEEQRVPVLYGRRAIGKTGVIVPYLNQQLGQILVLQAGMAQSPHPADLINAVCFVSVGGSDESGFDYQIEEQLQNIATSQGLDPNWAMNQGRITLDTTLETIQNLIIAIYSNKPGFSETDLLKGKWNKQLLEISGDLNDRNQIRTLERGMAQLLSLAEKTEYFKNRKFFFL